MYLLTTVAVVALLALFMFSGKLKVLAGSLLVIAVLIALIEFGISLIAIGISTETGRVSLVALGAVILVMALIYFMFDIAISIIYFMLDEKERKAFGHLLALRPWKVKEE